MKYNFCVFIKKSQRVDIFLSTLFGDFSRSRIQKIIDEGNLKINSKIVKKNIKINNKDEIEINIIITKAQLKGEKIKLEIIYEDDHILIINKDAGINVHPTPGENGKSGTLVNAILNHCKLKLPTIGGEERPGIVHRLDKETSGIIMIAKNDNMMSYLSNIIKERKIEKKYIAIVYGKIKEKYIKIESHIGRDKFDRMKMSIKNSINQRYALSHIYNKGYIDDKYTVVEVKIETGRTHQIRVHLSSIGFPILGDKVYSNEKINKEVEKKYNLKRQALHAYSLKFNLYGQEKAFFGELKDDMKKIIGDIK